ncbi:MAG: ferrous iron transport protein B [Clostridiales bacterium]|nr:ferrous iron transport protein B [Clostridiales bacterium]
MHKILIIGNPNVGKSTLFNTLTKSNEHTGNFHGVTVEEKHKIVTLDDERYDIVDLPGMYSFLSFSYEEEVSRDIILKTDATRILLVDANSIRRNLYLSLEMWELGLEHKILINNYDYFSHQKNKINLEKLNNNFGINAEIINAKKIKNNKNYIKNLKNDTKNSVKLPYLNYFLMIIKNKYNIEDKKIILALNGIFTDLKQEQINFIRSFYPEIIRARYEYIDELLLDSLEVRRDYVYGESKADRFLLNPFVMIIGFLLIFFVSIYFIFFLIGPILSDWLNALFDFMIVSPFMNFLYLTVDNIWLIEFFKSGVFSSISTIFSFLPQVILLFVFLTILEDSGIISRMAFVFDDFLSRLGLNGKAIYIMLLGLGCNTMSAVATRNMNGKNLKIKTAILSPYISCMARLPVFVVVASAFFGSKAYFVIAGLYILGVVVSLSLAWLLNKTILPTQNSELLLEFAPLRSIDVRHVLGVAKTNAVDMIKRIFGIIVSVGIIVWILSHTMFDLQYTDVIADSILFAVAGKISIIFAPIGLNNAGVVSALLVGIMAKELILSTMTITNSAVNNATLIASLVSATSVIHFSTAGALSFLIFSLLYAPCSSTLAVIKNECGKFYMWFSLISQFTLAYLLSFIVYLGMTQGFVIMLMIAIVMALILVSIMYTIKKIRRHKCLGCSRCK